jgi:Flp pilus assembly protein TadD
MELAERRRQLGMALGRLEAGQWQQTEEACGRLLARDAVDVEALLLLGLSVAARGQTQRAAAILDRVARERPHGAHPCADLTALLPRFTRTQITAQYRACLRMAPEDLRLRQAFASFFQEAGDPEAAVALLREGLQLHPNSAVAQHAMGLALAELGHNEEAIWHFNQAVTTDPRQAASWANLGLLLKVERQFDRAVAAYARAVAIAPSDAQIRVNRSVALLQAGRWAEAWTDFEWRLHIKGAVTLPLELLLPAVSEAGDLTDRTVLLTHEEGFGDTLQFLRYAPLLAKLGARVLAWVPEPLVRLTRTVPGIAAVFTGDGAPPAFDFHCPFVSLARVFGTTVTTVPRAPYLAADPALAAVWAERLPAATMRVGLTWAGQTRPWLPGFATVDRRRSAGLAAFAPLASVRGVQFVSLQTGAAAEQIRRMLGEAAPSEQALAGPALARPAFAGPGLAGIVSAVVGPPRGMAAGAMQAERAAAKAIPGWGAPIYDPMGQVEDFADTAAIIANLDLVVSVDTAVVHLAGAMGKPVFLLDRYDNCWRWLSGRTDSPWYPGVTIFRQQKLGDWTAPMERATAALQAMAAWRGAGDT